MTSQRLKESLEDKIKVQKEKDELESVILDLKTKCESKDSHNKYLESKLADNEVQLQNKIIESEES